MARHVQSTQNKKLVIFLQYIKKKVPQLLFCSIVMQNIQIFGGGALMFDVTCFLLFSYKNLILWDWEEKIINSYKIIIVSCNNF